MSFYFGLDPWAEIRRMERQMNKMMLNQLPQQSDSQDVVPSSSAVQNQQSQEVWWNPRTDLKETESDYQVITELPGVKKEDVSIDLSPEGLLTIKGKKENEKEEKNDKWHRVERSFGSFTRSFSIPKGVDPTKIAASYDNGVLKLMVPKAPEHQPLKIDIK